MLESPSILSNKSKGKRKLKICHLSDIHLGYRRFNRLSKQGFNQREIDVSMTFREAIDRCIALKPDISLICGDLFHSVRPSNSIITFGFKEIRRLQEKTRAPVLICAGNHETPKRFDTGSILRLFKEIPGVFVADLREEVFAFPELGISVLALPHARVSDLQSIKLRADEKYDYNVLMLHAQVDELRATDFGGIFLRLAQLSPHEWDYIAIGHLHSRKSLGLNAAYSGSIEHTSLDIWSGSNENKGFLLVDFPSGKQTFHALSTIRQVLDLGRVSGAGKEPDQITDMIVEKLEAIPGGVDGKIIRLGVSDLSRNVFRKLDGRRFKIFRSKALNLSIEFNPSVTIKPTTPVFTGLKRDSSIFNELIQYCKQRGSAFGEMPEVEKILKEYVAIIEGVNEVS